MVKLGIHGASGRVGRRLIAIGHAAQKFELTGAVCSPNSKHLGQDAGSLAGIGPIGLHLTSKLDSRPDVVIDFSSLAGAMSALEYCVGQRVPVVIATTGLTQTEQRQIEAGAARIAICQAPNMSLAVNLTMKLAVTAAQALTGQAAPVDVEIIERHHRFKADSPSGTALKFGSLIADAMGQTEHRHGRHGDIGQRPASEIGYHAVRGGDDPGQHTILFAMQGESIELRVAASNRDCYAQGALAAAAFLVDQEPGLYSMANVLGLV